ncbi:hypothetical protein FLW16_43150, partial [Microbispora sp. KK1-11]
MRGIPRHVACVMDGNGRWAAQRSLPRTEGHRAAEAAVLDVIEAAHTAGVEWIGRGRGGGRGGGVVVSPVVAGGVQ